MTMATQDAATRASDPADRSSRPAALDTAGLTTTDAGDSGWRVTDDRTGADDPRHVVAFIRDRGSDVEVLWIRGTIAAPGRFPTIGDALHAIRDCVEDR